jgi:hypothetical protein
MSYNCLLVCIGNLVWADFQMIRICKSDLGCVQNITSNQDTKIEFYNVYSCMCMIYLTSDQIHLNPCQVSVTVTVTVTDNLLQHELQKSLHPSPVAGVPAVMPTCLELPYMKCA